ncbi:MAG: hypothetical protein ACOCWQ_00400 [Nanoarchaeota archaeon]
MGVRSFVRNHSLNRVTRIESRLHPYVEYLGKLKTTKKQSERIREYLSQFHRLRTRARILYVLRGIVVIFLYISVISAIAPDILFLGRALEKVSVITGIVGTGFFFICLAIVTKYIQLFVSDAHVIADHIIATAVHNGYNSH